MGKQHQKHAKLFRLDYGDYHTSEWGIIGAPCGRIQQLAEQLTAGISAYYRLAYVDADHAAGDEAEQLSVEGSRLVYTDKINFRRIDHSGTHNKFYQRPLFQSVDGVLVNGNHFFAKRQIVILDPKKEASLERKLDRLTDVALILTTEGQVVPYSFLKKHLEGRMPLMMPIGDINGILQWLRAQFTAAVAPLYGLVLAGGQSTRMGKDKGIIDYHGIPQKEYAYQLLEECCQKTYLSVSDDEGGANIIADTFTDLGPFGAILSAFRQHPEAAWLVVACDLPLIDSETIQALVQARNPSKVATAFYNEATAWPDPLLTIWEPRSYAVLLQFLAQGYSCPRKVLINSEVRTVQPQHAHWLLNANTPEERNEVNTIIQSKR